MTGPGILQAVKSVKIYTTPYCPFCVTAKRLLERKGVEYEEIDVARDDEALTLQIPSDGGVRSLRALLDRLDRDSIDVDGLSVHTPDLDDVFLALTGQPDKQGHPDNQMETVR